MAPQGGQGESRTGRCTIGENKGKKLRQGRDHIGDKAIEWGGLVKLLEMQELLSVPLPKKKNRREETRKINKAGRDLKKFLTTDLNQLREKYLKTSPNPNTSNSGCSISS